MLGFLLNLRLTPASLLQMQNQFSILHQVTFTNMHLKLGSPGAQGDTWGKLLFWGG